jgi:hypothetical protein
LKPGAFKLWVNWIQLVQPCRERPERAHEDIERWPPEPVTRHHLTLGIGVREQDAYEPVAARQVEKGVNLDVAVQVDPLKANFETSFSLCRLKG